jgi:hypothetical protein
VAPRERGGATRPNGVDPEVPLTDHREDGLLGYGVGVEVMELHPIIMWERRHEAAYGHPRTPARGRG